MDGRDGARDHPAPRRPPALVVAVATVAAESMVLVGLTVYVVVTTLSGPGSLLSVVPLVVLPLAVAAGLASVARGLLRGRRWARAPVITWQLFQLVLLQPALGSAALRPWAVAALLVSVAAVVAVLTPAALRATAGPKAPPLT